jgi:REP element-mobilizing transposase RayT
MARHVRIRVLGGWYHVCTRGHNRERIFTDSRDYTHFQELVGAMRERFRVRVYAYCLMPNHYHLLISTPEANVSRAIQWLNGSYGIWYNRRHNRTGHLFGERFKAVLVEDSGWGLEVSVYIHMNPVATEEMGLGKKRRAAQRQGIERPATREELQRRLKGIREYEWSSYAGYAGYRKSPVWLDRACLLSRAGNEGEKSYRRLVEGRILQGEEESLQSKIRWGLVLGAERFAKKVRGRIRVDREHEGRNELKRRKGFEEIVRMVERIKHEKWDLFRDRYGDWGRDLVMWACFHYGGMRLREVGEHVGGIDYSAVAMGVRRVDLQARKNRELRAAMIRVKKECAL